MNTNLLWLIPLLPFTGFLINGTLGRRLPRALVATVALLFTLAPAAIVAQLWMYIMSAGAPLPSAACLGSPSAASMWTSRLRWIT
jgi:NADH-quinone oxidoreductase subunit L